MTHTGYEITHYRPELQAQALHVLQYLWPGDSDRNLYHFRWKYDRNPNSKAPLGIVALYQAQVVGFRGYFATRFEIVGKTDNLVVLCSGDTVVHPDHRRKGLSVAMGKLAMQQYAAHYKLFLNMTCNRRSLPGYLKMGFRPLAMRVYLSRSTLLGVVRHSLTANATLSLDESGITYARFGDILVSQVPRPAEMAAIAAQYKREDGRIWPYQDERFFHWRFDNGRKYVFYYLMSKDVATAYVVLGVSPNNQRGYILDYGESGRGGIEAILGHAVKAKHFGILSIYGFAADAALLWTLRRLGFTEYGLVRFLEKSLHGERPVLIRPVIEHCSDSDFLIEGIDTRKIENWALKPICSDGA